MVLGSGRGPEISFKAPMFPEASRVEHEYLPPTLLIIMSRYPRPALPETAWQRLEQTGGEHWGSNLPGVQPQVAVKRRLTDSQEVGATSASSARSTAEHRERVSVPAATPD